MEFIKHRSFLSFCVIFLLFVVLPKTTSAQNAIAHADLLDASQFDAVTPGVNWMHNLPRFGMDGLRKTNNFDAGSWDYWQGVLMLGLPGAAIAVLCLICFPVVFCFRYCLDTCGGRKASRRYSPKEVNIYRFVLVILVGLAVVGCIIGLTGNGIFGNGINKTFNAVTGAAHDLGSLANHVDTTTNNLLNQTGSKPTELFKSLEGTALSIASTSDSGRRIALGYDSYRLLALWIGFGLAIAAGVCGILAIVLRKGWLATTMAIIAWMVLFLMWLLFAICFVISIVMSDVCFALDQSITSKNVTANPLEFFLKCPPELSSESTGIWDFIDEQIKSTKDALDFAPPGELKNRLAIQLGDLEDLEDKLDDTFKDCKFIILTFSRIKGGICGDLLNSLTLIYVGSVIVGVIYLIGIFIAMLGSKRFVPHKESEEDVSLLSTYDNRF